MSPVAPQTVGDLKSEVEDADGRLVGMRPGLALKSYTAIILRGPADDGAGRASGGRGAAMGAGAPMGPHDAASSGLAEVYVHLASRIGDPVDQPWVGVQVVLADGAALGDVEGVIRETVETEIERLAEFRARLGRGEFSIC